MKKLHSQINQFAKASGSWGRFLFQSNEPSELFEQGDGNNHFGLPTEAVNNIVEDEERRQKKPRRMVDIPDKVKKEIIGITQKDIDADYGRS